MSKKSVAKPRSSPVQRAAKTVVGKPRTRRSFTDEFRREAVAMLLDGHSASSVAGRLGITTNMLYRWKSAQLNESGPVAESLEARVHELEAELSRVTRERDILKKALVIFGRSE
jgi:transposase